MGREAKRQEPMTAEEQSVYSSLITTARKSAIVFARRNRLDYEEIAAEAMLLLVGVMREYQHEPGKCIRSFVGQRIKLRLADSFRKRGFNGLSLCDSRTAKRNAGGSHKAIFGGDELLEYEDPASDDLEGRSMIERLKSTGIRWDIIEALLGWTSCVDIARRCGVCRSNVYQTRATAVWILQNEKWLQREVEP